MDRWAAADLLRKVTTERFGSAEQAVAAGWRCATTAALLPQRSLPSRDRPPRDRPLAGVPLRARTNGCVEKFIQTLKEQELWIERFDTLEQLRAGIRRFARDYNQSWLLERHGYRPHDKRASA